VTYDIGITDFAPDARVTRAVVRTAVDAWTAARVAEACDSCVLLVGRHADNASHGDFHVWLAGDRALVRLDEHRDWYATDPEAGSAGDGEVEFSGLRRHLPRAIPTNVVETRSL
jgi:hypothetical protein